MKKIVKILFLFILVVVFSCEDLFLFVKCSDCTADEPLNTNLEIKIDNNNFDKVLINVYEGDLEDNIFYSSYNVSGKGTTIPVTLNKKYTLTAKYSTSENSYIVVNSAMPRVIYDKKQCESPCYFVYDKDVDLRLKRTK
jgi:hypothetical protein